MEAMAGNGKKYNIPMLRCEIEKLAFYWAIRKPRDQKEEEVRLLIMSNFQLNDMTWLIFG